MTTHLPALPLRVSDGDGPSIGRTVRGRQGFLKLNMQLDFESHSREGREFSVVAKSLGPVAIGRVVGTAARFGRARRHFADGRDLISLVISGGVDFQLEDARGVDRYGRNGAAVLESRAESNLCSLNDGLAWTICMERAPLEPLLARLDAPVQRCLHAGNPALRLLIGYVDSLFALEQEFDPLLAATHVSDLAINALGVSGEAQVLVRERGVRMAHRRAVLDLIAQCAADPSFAPARAAEHLGISLRHLHGLLELTGRSFSEHLLDERLKRASAMLRDQGCRDLKIAEIASQAGFADISHFNRSFRRCFGDTPLGVRARARRAS